MHASACGHSQWRRPRNGLIISGNQPTICPSPHPSTVGRPPTSLRLMGQTYPLYPKQPPFQTLLPLDEMRKMIATSAQGSPSLRTLSNSIPHPRVLLHLLGPVLHPDAKTMQAEKKGRIFSCILLRHHLLPILAPRVRPPPHLHLRPTPKLFHHPSCPHQVAVTSWLVSARLASNLISRTL